MEKNNVPYQRQIFVCTNDAKGEKQSCGDHQGEAVFRGLREIAKERKLHPQIRVAQAKCLGQCAKGVNIMIYSATPLPPLADGASQNNSPKPCHRQGEGEYPENIWLSGVRLEDVPKLADQYIIDKS